MDERVGWFMRTIADWNGGEREIDQQFGAWDVSVDRAIELGDGRRRAAWKLGFDDGKAVLMKTYTDLERAHLEAGLEPPPEDAS